MWSPCLLAWKQLCMSVFIYLFIRRACGFWGSSLPYRRTCVCVCVLTLSAVWRKHIWWLMISEGGRLLQSCDTVWKQQRHGLEKWPDHRSIRKTGKQKGRVAAAQITGFLIVNIVRLVNVIVTERQYRCVQNVCVLFIYIFISSNSYAYSSLLIHIKRWTTLKTWLDNIFS